MLVKYFKLLSEARKIDYKVQWKEQARIEKPF